ncbi:MAG TPA: DUF559 domain-containing protein [Draconibacterium sp.]|nr:DUF559 domain-containing protein [Draconibacterium sp.]
MRPFRKGLREKLTQAEASLWILIKNRQAFGLKFRRQTSIENFVIDFYCAGLEMIIELDGEPHFTQKQADTDQKLDKHCFNWVIKYSDMKIKLYSTTRISFLMI